VTCLPIRQFTMQLAQNSLDTGYNLIRISLWALLWLLDWQQNRNGILM